MADSLKVRLARLRKLGMAKASELGGGDGSGRPGDPGPPGPRATSTRGGAIVRRGRPSFLGAWESAGEMAWKRTLSLPDCLPESVDPNVFAPLRSLRRGAGRGEDTGGGIVAERVAAARLRFFDLETTGLSGGTGTIAFLAAVGRLVNGEFAITQVFLEDYPGEPNFLSAVLPLLEGGALVSYNGRSFDMPLLRTRCIMNGIAPPLPELHIDALFASRRLWRRVHGGASLGLLEREVLGSERPEDLPGAMIPEAWLSFAREGDSPLMRLVLSHNADDVFGLARLLAKAQAAFDHPRAHLARSDVDRAGLGRSLLAVGREGEGEALLEAAAGDGDEAAGLLLAMRFRKSGRADDGARVATMLPSTYRSAIERARIFERLFGDLAEAARWVAEAQRLARSEAESDTARARLERLDRIVSRRARGGARPA